MIDHYDAPCDDAASCYNRVEASGWGESRSFAAHGSLASVSHRLRRGTHLHVNGTYTFKADKQAVYDLMMSQDALTHCLPGCEGMEKIGEAQYHATLKIGIAGIKGTYVCTITMTEQMPPDTWTLTVEGRAKSGNLKGVGRFSLADKDDGTEMTYDGEAELMGPLAGVGQRVMAPAARMIIGRFFECMSGQLAESNG